MSFKRTLRYVIAARAATVLFSGIALALYCYLVQSRLMARVAWARITYANNPLGVEVKNPAHSGWGGLALIGVSDILILQITRRDELT